MSAPESDRAALRQVIRALRVAGWVPDRVDNGEDVEVTPGETAMLDAIFEVDSAVAFFDGPDGATGYILAVLGNDPDEVVCDYTVNLDPTISEVTQWWDS